MKLPGKQMPIGLLHRTYSVATTCVLPLALAGLALSARGRRRLAERLGFWEPTPAVSWWLHGASVGEVQGLLPFIEQIRAVRSGEDILLTTTSPTGLDRAVNRVDVARLAPLDAPWSVNRILNRLSYQRLVISETELWPNLLRGSLCRGVPCHVINGRISDYTFDWYKRTRSLFQPLCRALSSVSVADNEQSQRYVSMGVPADRVHVTGHTKYDYRPTYDRQADRLALRTEFFSPPDPSERVVTLGSLREGEESVWFPAIARALEDRLPVRFIVAPRHSERFEYFWHAIERLGVSCARWSSMQNEKGRLAKVVLLDTMGLLEKAYAASDLAFVGATLVDIGGHNPFEPAMYGVPIVVGPFTSVIREPIDALARAGGLLRVTHAGDAYDVLLRCATQSEHLATIGSAALSVWRGFTGASQRVLEVIQMSEGVSS